MSNLFEKKCRGLICRKGCGEAPSLFGARSRGCKSSEFGVSFATVRFPNIREYGRAERIPKVRSNKARTQAARCRELGLAACGELAGVVAETLMCRRSVHGGYIGDPKWNVNACCIAPIPRLDRGGEILNLIVRAGPLWRSSSDERDVGPHRVISMSRPGLFASSHRDRPDRSIFGWRAALTIFSHRLTRLDAVVRARTLRHWQD